MAYIVVDIFLKSDAAEIRAEAYKQSGRRNVRIIEVNGITVNDCTMV